MSEEQTSKKKFEFSPSLAILASGILIAAAIVYVNAHPAAAEPAAAAAAQATTPTTVTVRPPSSNEHIIGSPNAPIVLIEYADFQCPFCSMIYPTLKQIVSQSNGQIAWVYREFPLYQIHPQATPAALAAECINAQLGNDGFWKFADTIFGDQSKMSPQYYAQLAAQFGADPTKFAQCVSSAQYQNVLDTSSAEAEQNGGDGTPFTIVYNTKTGKGTPIEGALPYAQIMSVIQAAQ